jgi:hypothetical protein
MQHPHLEALHDLGSVPYDEALGPRTNKENILEEYGFSKGANPAEFVVFDYSDTEPVDTLGYLSQKIDEGKYTALLFRDGKWESMGGCAVVYVMGQTHIDEKLSFDETGRVTQVVAGGETFSPSESTKLNTYTRRRSANARLEGFDNYPEPLDVALGGGFRLQVDGIIYEGGKPFLTMSAYFSFNDYGSRVLARENEDDASVPMASRSFRVPIVDGELELPVKDIERSDIVTAGDAMDLVLSELFTNDGKAISNLTRDLLTVRPAMQIHQFEGIYGVSDENGVSAEVIDFDGLDTFDLTPSAVSPSERLAGGQLIQAGYLREVDGGARVTYYQQQADVHNSLGQLSGLETVCDDVKGLASLRPGESITTYANRLSAYGRLARSIDYCGLDWTATTAPNVMQTTVNGWTITKVEAGGFESAFIERDGKIVPVQNAKEIYDLTKQVLGGSMLRLYVSLSREGD